MLISVCAGNGGCWLYWQPYIGGTPLQRVYEAFVIDNLSNGHEEALARVKQLANQDFGFVQGDIRDGEALRKSICRFQA